MGVNEHLRLILEVNDLSPVVGHASTNLNVTSGFTSRLDVHHLLSLNKVGNVSLVINSAGMVAGPKAITVTSREESDGELFTANEHWLDFNDLLVIESE